MSNYLKDVSFNSDTLDDSHSSEDYDNDTGSLHFNSDSKVEFEDSIISDDWKRGFPSTDGSVINMSIHGSKFTEREDGEEFLLSQLRSVIVHLRSVNPGQYQDISQPITLLEGIEDFLKTNHSPNFNTHKNVRSSFQGIASSSFYDNSHMSTTSSFIDNELDQQAEILKGMQDNLSQICAEKEIISKENEQLQMQLDDLKKSYSSLEADKDELIEQLTSEKTKHTQEMSILKKSFHDLTKKIENSESEYNSTVKNHQEAKLRIVKLENELNEIKSVRTSASFLQEPISEGMRIKKGELSDSSESSSSDSEFSVNNIENQCSDTEIDNIKEISSWKYNKKNFNKLQNILVTKTSTFSYYSSDTNKYDQEFIDNKIDLESDLADQKSYNTYLSELLDKKNNEIKELINKLSETNKEKLDLEEKFNLTSHQNKIKIIDSDGEIEVLRESLIKSEKRIAQNKIDLDNLKNQLNNASTMSSIEDNNYLFIKNENDILRSEKQNLQDENKNFEDKNKMLEEKIFQNGITIQSLFIHLQSQNYSNSNLSMTKNIEDKLNCYNDKIQKLLLQVKYLYSHNESNTSSFTIEPAKDEDNIPISNDKNKIIQLDDQLNELKNQLQDTHLKLSKANEVINNQKLTISSLEEKNNQILLSVPNDYHIKSVNPPQIITPEDLHNLKSSLYATETRCHQLSLEHTKLFSHSLRIIIYLESECIRLKNLGDHFKSSNAKLHHDITRLSSFSIRLKYEENNNKNLTKKIETLKNLNTKANNTIDNLNNKLLNLNNTNEKDYEVQLNLLREENEKFTNDLELKTQELKLISTQLEVEKNNHVSLIEEKNNQIEELNLKFMDTTSLYNDLKSKKPLLEDKNDKNKITQLENKLKDFSSKFNNEQQINAIKINDLESKNSSFQNEIQLKITMIENLEKQSINLKNELEKSETKMFELQTQYTSLLKKYSEFESKFSTLNEENKKLEEELSKLTTNNSEFQLQIKDLTFKNESLNEDLVYTKSKKLPEINEKYTTLELNLEKIQNMNYTLTNQIDTIQSEYQSLNSEYHTNLDNYKDLQDRCSSLQVSETVYLTEIKTLKKRNESLTQKIQETENKLAKFEIIQEELQLEKETSKKFGDVVSNYKKSEEFFVSILKKWNEYFSKNNKRSNKEFIANFDLDNSFNESKSSLNLYQLSDFSLELTQLKLNFKEFFSNYFSVISEKKQLYDEFEIFKYHTNNNSKMSMNYKSKYFKVKSKLNKKSLLLNRLKNLNNKNSNVINSLNKNLTNINNKNKKNYIIFLQSIKKFFEEHSNVPSLSADSIGTAQDEKKSSKFSLPPALVNFFNLNSSDPVSLIPLDDDEFEFVDLINTDTTSPLSSPLPSDSEDEKTINTVENNDLELAFLSLTSSNLINAPALDSTIDSFSSFSHHQEVLLHFLQHLISGFLNDNRSLHSHLITIHNNNSINFNEFSIQKDTFVIEVEKLKEEKKKLNTQIEILTEKFNSNIKNSKEAFDQVDNLKSQIVTLSEELSMTQELNNEIISSNKSLELLYNENTNNFNILKNEYEETIINNKNYINDLEDQKKIISSMELKIEQINSALNRTKSQKDMLNSIKNTLEIEINTIRNEKSSLFEESFTLFFNKIYLDSETLCTHIDSCSELVEYVKETPPPPSLALDESKVGDSNKEEFEEKFSILKNKIAFSIEKLIRLRYWLNKNNQSIKFNEKNSLSNKNEITKLNDIIRVLNEENSKLKHINNSTMMDLKKADNELIALKNQNEESRSSFEDIKQSFDSLNVTVQELKEEKEKADRISHDIKLKNQLMHENLKITNDKNSSLESHIKELNFIIARHEKDSLSHASKYETLKSQYNTLFGEIEKLHVSIDKKSDLLVTDKVITYNSKEEELEKHISSLNKSLESKQNELLMLRRKFVALEEENKNFSVEKDVKIQTTYKLENNIKIINEEKNSLNQEILHIRHQLNEKNSTITNLENIIKQLQEEKSKLVEFLNNPVNIDNSNKIKKDDKNVKNEDRNQIIQLKSTIVSKNEEINKLDIKNKEFNLLLNHYSNSLRNQGKKTREIIKEIVQTLKKFFNIMKIDIASYQEISNQDDKGIKIYEHTRNDNIFNLSELDLDNILKPLPPDYNFDFTQEFKENDSFNSLKLDEALGVNDLYHFINQICHINSPYLMIQQELKKIKLLSSQVKKFSIENNNLKNSLKDLIENQKQTEKMNTKTIEDCKKKISLLEKEITSLNLNQVTSGSNNDKNKDNYEMVLETKEHQYQTLMKEYSTLLISYKKSLTKETSELKNDREVHKKEDNEEKKREKEEELLKKIEGLTHHNIMLKQAMERLEVTCIQRIESVAENMILKYKNSGSSMTSFNHGDDLLKWEVYKNDLRTKIVTDMINIYRAGITNLFSDCKIITSSSSSVSCQLFSLVGLHWMEKEIQTVQAGYESEINFQDLHIKELYQNIKNLNNVVFELKKKYEEQLYISYNSSSNLNSHTSSVSNLLKNVSRLIDEVNHVSNYQEKEKKLHRDQYNKIIEDLTQVLKRREQALLALKNLEDYNKKHNINISGYERFHDLIKEYSIDSHGSHFNIVPATYVSNTSHVNSTYKSSGTAVLRTNH